MKHINARGLDLIKAHEGLRLTAYQCPAGKWTIGWGHTLTAKKGLTITEAAAEDLLIEDVVWAEAAVRKLVTVPLNTNQFSALVSWVFNIGETAARNSTLIKMLNQGDYKAVPVQLQRWTRGGGVELPGLVRRREEEAALFEAPDAGDLVKSRTVGGAVAGGLSIGAMAAGLQDMLAELAPLAGYGGAMAVALKVVAMAAFALVLYARVDDWRKGWR